MLISLKFECGSDKRSFYLYSTMWEGEVLKCIRLFSLLSHKKKKIYISENVMI